MRRSEPSTFEAVLPIVVMVVLFAAGAIVLGTSSELLVAVLLGAAATAGWIAIRHGATWDDIQRSTGEKLAAVLPAILILLSIGLLIGSWVLSGTIPLLVAIGIDLVHPRFLLLTAFLATATMSLFTGTSWGSAGTIGVALMGTAAALGVPLAPVAGAVVSGAYFGDKLSPLSDMTNICAIAADVPLYRHIRHLLYTAVPSFLIALLVYSAAAGMAQPVSDSATAATALRDELARVFRLHPLALLPAALVIWSIVRKQPPALAISLAALVAIALGVTLQPFTLGDAIRAGVSGFDPAMVRAAGVEPATLSDDFVTLVARGGLFSMATTLIFILAAFLLAGAMDVSGALDLLVRRMIAAVRSVFGLIGATIASGLTMIALTSHGGVTALVIGGLYKEAYAERGLAPENLSRSLEDSITITEPLMPWTVSAVFMATTLGVPTIAYAPWAVFCYGGPFFSLLIAALHPHVRFGLRELPVAAPAPEAAASRAPV